MNQNDDADGDARGDAATADHRQSAPDTDEPALEVLRDPESGRVTFAVHDPDSNKKLTEWLTVDGEHVVDAADMQ